MGTSLYDILRIKVQPQHQVLALGAGCLRVIGDCRDLCLGQLALVHARLRNLACQHGAVHAAAAVGQQRAGVREANIRRGPRPVLDFGIECGGIDVPAVILILVRIAARCAVKTANILHPFAFFDPGIGVCVVIVPEELAIVIIKADANGHFARGANGHAVEVVGAPADGYALGHERVVVTSGRRQGINTRAFADRQLGPYHTGNAIVDDKVLIVWDLDVILVAVEDDRAVAVVIGPDGRLAVQITVIPHARLVNDHGHALDGALDVNGLGFGIADTDGKLTGLLKLIGELTGLDFSSLQRVLLALDRLIVNIQGCSRGAVLVSDVSDVSLDVEQIAVNVTDLPIT